MVYYQNKALKAFHALVSFLPEEPLGHFSTTVLFVLWSGSFDGKWDECLASFAKHAGHFSKAKLQIIHPFHITLNTGCTMYNCKILNFLTCWCFIHFSDHKAFQFWYKYFKRGFFNSLFHSLSSFYHYYQWVARQRLLVGSCLHGVKTIWKLSQNWCIKTESKCCIFW